MCSLFHLLLFFYPFFSYFPLKGILLKSFADTDPKIRGHTTRERKNKELGEEKIAKACMIVNIIESPKMVNVLCVLSCDSETKGERRGSKRGMVLRIKRDVVDEELKKRV